MIYQTSQLFLKTAPPFIFPPLHSCPFFVLVTFLFCDLPLLFSSLLPLTVSQTSPNRLRPSSCSSLPFISLSSPSSSSFLTV